MQPPKTHHQVLDGPRWQASAPPQTTPPEPDSAPWQALPLPLCPRLMDDDAREHMAALAGFCDALRRLQDFPDMTTEARLARLDALELALSGAFGPALQRPELRVAVVLRESLLKTGGSFQDMLALTDACRDEFRGDAARGQELDEAGWLDHAARAAAPVLRYLMLLHGERREEILTRADDVARLWHLLPAAPESWRPVLQRLSRETAGLWREVEHPALRGQLYRLQALASVALAKPLWDALLRNSTGHDGGLEAPAGASPAQALRRKLPWPARARIYWRAWRMMRGG